jgi:hypothetical protein
MQNAGALSLTFAKSSFDALPNRIDASITNGTSKPVMKALGYVVERNNVDEWDIVFESETAIEEEYIQPGETISFSVVVGASGEKLEAGTYRVRLFDMGDVSAMFLIND